MLLVGLSLLEEVFISGSRALLLTVASFIKKISRLCFSQLELFLAGNYGMQLIQFKKDIRQLHTREIVGIICFATTIIPYFKSNYLSGGNLRKTKK